MTSQPSPALQRLRTEIAAHSKLLVAYSGGADSALLAFVAHEVLGSDAVAVTGVSPSLAAAERTLAQAFARAHGINHVEVCTDEFTRPDYLKNDKSRCYHCKSALFDAIQPLATVSGAMIALGTNLDDLGDYRPGQDAARERGVAAPLVAAGLTKAHVREISAELGLETAAKIASPCLSSRVAYADPVSPEVLARIDAAESALRELGFQYLRVRDHGSGQVARLEFGAAECEAAFERRADIERALKACGYAFVAQDLGAFASGRLNSMLSLTVAQ